MPRNLQWEYIIYVFMDEGGISDNIMSVIGTDNGEAVPRRWYVLHTRMHGERRTVANLSRFGMESFLPLQVEVHQWSDRKKKVARLLLPMMVFVRLNQEEKAILQRFPDTFKFLKDRVHKDSLMVVPDDQMQRFIFMVTRADTEVSIEPPVFHRGDMVRICKGGLRGMRGIMVRCPDGSAKVVIRIAHLACASVVISEEWLENA